MALAAEISASWRTVCLVGTLTAATIVVLWQACHEGQLAYQRSAHCTALAAEISASWRTVCFVGTLTMTTLGASTAAVAVVSCSLMAISSAAARMLCTIFARMPL